MRLRQFPPALPGIASCVLVAAWLPAEQSPQFVSAITIHDLNTRTSAVLYRGDGIWEAPNWSRDGTFLLVNSNGKLYRIPVDGSSAPEALALDPSLRANNDHDFSPDGKRLAISATSASSRQSQVYVASADGSDHRLVVAARATRRRLEHLADAGRRLRRVQREGAAHHQRQARRLVPASVA